MTKPRGVADQVVRVSATPVEQSFERRGKVVASTIFGLAGLGIVAVIWLILRLVF